MVRTDQMMGEIYKPEWRSIGESVKGASHERSGRPNQDALYCSPTSGGSLPLIVAVSDGHGGAKYFRSEKGAILAVDAAFYSLSRFQEDLASFSISSRMELEQHLTKSLVNTWRSEVEAHLQSEPFLDEELGLLEEYEGFTVRQAVQANPVLAYGATILTVMVTESFIAYLQLGDGDILTVSKEGLTSKVFPKNKRHFANETTSLCASDPWRDFQFRLEKVSPASSLPALILLSTDGYVDSFSSEQEFFKVGSDLFEMMRSNNLEVIKHNLSDWLSEATQRGSGDDITLGVLCRIDAFVEPTSSQFVEQENHSTEENLELASQSGYCHELLQPDQASIRDAFRGEVEESMGC